MKTLRKWPLLYRHIGKIGGRPYLGRIQVGGVSTWNLWLVSAGSESPEHLKEIQRRWPWLQEKEIKQAIRFERSRGRCAGTQNYGGESSLA